MYKFPFTGLACDDNNGRSSIARRRRGEVFVSHRNGSRLRALNQCDPRHPSRDSMMIIQRRNVIIGQSQHTAQDGRVRVSDQRDSISTRGTTRIQVGGRRALKQFFPSLSLSLSFAPNVPLHFIAFAWVHVYTPGACDRRSLKSAARLPTVT